MKNNHITKCLCFLLAAVMICVSFPTIAIAEDTALDVQAPSTDASLPEAQADTEVYILQEDVSKRGAFEKHYLCSDGTFAVATYAEAVHYQDDDGAWQNVDMRFAADASTLNATPTAQNQDFKLAVPTTATEGHLMRMEKDDHSFAWTLTAQKANTLTANATVSRAALPAEQITLQASAQITPQIESQKATAAEAQPDTTRRVLSDADAFALPNVSNRVTYDDLFGEDAGVSVVYTTYHNKVEEDIYIHKPTDITSFSMRVDAPDLIPRVNPDNSVDFLDREGEMVYHVGIPYLMDAEHAVTYDILTTAMAEDGQWVITYTPDKEWLNADERAYPILLDPSITTNEYVANIEDTYVGADDDTDHSAEQQLLLINNSQWVIIRVKNMPAIDPNIPILDASLSLTALYGPFSESSVANYRLDYTEAYTNISLSDSSDWGNSNDADDSDDLIGSEFASFAYQMYNMIHVSFSLKNYIYDILEGNGDFIIRHDFSQSSSFGGFFYSSENTAADMRPVLSVTYGYPMTAGALDGQVFYIENWQSMRYVTVPGTNPANNTNVYQSSNYGGTLTVNHQFKFEYQPASGTYLIRAMCSNNGAGKVLDIQRAGGEIYSGRNVQIYTDNDPMSQEWYVIPVNEIGFRIVPKANMALSLATYGDGNGTSDGNIFVQTTNPNNNYQYWLLMDDNGDYLELFAEESSVQSGLYYITNQNSGRYLHRDGNSAESARGTLEYLEPQTVQWYVANLGNGYCTIQNTDTMRALCYDKGNVRLIPMTETVADKFQWQLTASNGGYYIQSKIAKISTMSLNTLYLDDRGDLLSSEYAVTFNNYTGTYSQRWELHAVDTYKEADASLTVTGPTVDISQSAKPTVSNPQGCTLARASDFYYQTLSNAVVSINNVTGTFTGASSGTAIISALHKTTGTLYLLSAKVNKNAIIIVPGIFGSELFVGANNPYFDEGDHLISTDVIAALSEGLSWNEILPLLDPIIRTLSLTNTALYANALYESISCNEDGSSKYPVYTKQFSPLEISEEDADLYTPYCGTIDTYRPLYDKLVENTELTNQYKIEFFSYDWRLSNAISAQKLDEFVSSKGYDRVILIAHSMGGLVASGYAARLGASQANKIKGIYYVASPLLGSAEVINAWYNADISGLAGDSPFNDWIPLIEGILGLVTLEIKPIRKLISNYQSIYELIPTERYFSLANQSYLEIHETSVVPLNTYDTVTQCTTYTATMNRVSNILFEFDDDLMTQAESFHNSLFLSSGNHISTLCNPYYLYGYFDSNSTVTTRTRFIYSKVIAVGSTTTTLTIASEDSTAGDSLVAKWSATLGGGAPYGQRIYRCKNWGHTRIISNKINDENQPVYSPILNTIADHILGANNFTSGNGIEQGYDNT